MIGSTRRQFLRQAAGSGLWALGNLPLISGLHAVSAAEAQLDPGTVRFQPDIEPLVRLLEDTPREHLLEEVGVRIRDGLSYREVLAALLLAGVRNVQPRPAVGFKFHAVLVVNSAHLASLSSPDADRWLPIFWALDYFKSSQAQDEREGNWTMPPVDEAAVPAADKADVAFRQAMDQWDESAADAAIAGLARTQGADQLFEVFARYGARDFRSIGHKAIYVSNGFRTLQCIGWRYAEPVLRSLAYALLNHEGQPNPAENDLGNDRPWRENLVLAQHIRPAWLQGRIDDGATRLLLESLRVDSPTLVCQQIVEILNAGVSPQSVYDALFAAAGELLMRQPGIVSLHASTTTNAMRYAFDTAADDTTRRMLLLQNAAFLPLFREQMKERTLLGNERIDELQPVSMSGETNPVEQVFDSLSKDPLLAATQLYGCLEQGMAPEKIIRAATTGLFER